MRVSLRRFLTRVGLVKHPTFDGVHLSVVNQLGSVQHYYHFMLGFVVPLVQAWPDLVAKAAGRPIYVRSCAVMDPILNALKLEGLCILAPATHRSLKENAKRLGRTGHRLDFVSLQGFDTPSKYNPDVFWQVRARLFDQLAAEIAAEREALKPLFKAGGPKVLIIDRLPSDPFYNSENSEMKGAGADRRSISNIAELAELARLRFASVEVVTLEGRSLAAQMALFSMADVIFAQHGAALANLLWARRGANVIEVMSSLHFASDLFPFFFSKLSQAMDLHHDVLHQPIDHGPVSVKEFAALIDTVAQTRALSAST